MDEATTAAAAEEDRRGVARVALWTVALALGLFVAKLAAALASDSIGVVSTAVDSGLDLLIALTVYAGVRLARLPADREHPYGHGKFENVAGLAEAGILAATGVIVGFFAVQRILDPPPVRADAWVIGVMVVAILVDAERAWTLRKATREHRSPALEADTWHFTSDLITTAVVLVGLYLGTRGYPRADGVAALVVALFIVGGSVYVAWRSVGGLVDRIEPRVLERVRRAIERVEAVEGTPQVRVRGAGPDLFVDATVEIPRAMGMEKAHRVMDDVEAAVRDEIGQADVTVHAEPVEAREDAATKLKVLAARERGILGIHEIFVDDLDGGLVVDCHVEVDEDLTLEQAHDIAQAFEAMVKDTIPEVVGMRTHIEPMPRHPRSGEDVTARHDELVERIEASIAAEPFAGPGPIVIKRVGQRLEAIVTAIAPGEISLERAHEAAESLERVLHAKLPELDRVVVHVEPES